MKIKQKKSTASFQIKRGMIFGLSQAVWTAGSQLILIRVLIAAKGLDALGLWALVTAICAPLRIADFAGFSSSYFVARSLANDESIERTAGYVQCNFFASAGLMGASAVALSLAAPIFCDIFLEQPQLGDALRVLPIVMLSTIAQSLSLNLATALDGLQKSFLRSIAVITGTSINLLVSVLLIERYGLTGIAIGQTAMAVVTAILSAIFLARYLPLFRAPHWPSMKTNLGEILKYGARMQSVNWSQGLFEPAVRFAIGNAGGLLILGVYEAAQRVLGQGRSLISQMLYPLIPAITNLRSTSSDGARKFIWMWHVRCAVFVVCAAPVSSFLPDIVATVVLGDMNDSFNQLYFILSVPMWYTISTFPLYYLGPATSLFRWNAIGSGASLALLFLFFYINKFFEISNGVVWCASVAALIGITVSTILNALTCELEHKRHIILSLITLILVSIPNLIAYTYFGKL